MYPSVRILFPGCNGHNFCIVLSRLSRFPFNPSAFAPITITCLSFGFINDRLVMLLLLDIFEILSYLQFGLSFVFKSILKGCFWIIEERNGEFVDL